MLHKVRGSQEARPMFDPCEDVREGAQSVQEIWLVHELKASREGGPMFAPRKDLPFCGD